MRIIVTNLKGKEVDSITTSPSSLARDIEDVKKKYPVGQFHAQLETY